MTVFAWILIIVGLIFVVMALLSEKHIKRLVTIGVVLIAASIGLFTSIVTDDKSDIKSTNVEDAPESLNERCVELKDWLKKQDFKLAKDKNGNERCDYADAPEGSTIDDVNEDDIVAYVQEGSDVVGYLLTDDGKGGFEVVTSDANITKKK